MLSSISSKDEVPIALQAYENAQKARAEHIQQSCLTTRAALHLPDGPEQEARDQKFRALSAGGGSDDKWGDPEFQKFIWGWDAEAKAEEARQRAEARLAQKLTDEDAASASAALAHSLAQLKVKRRQR